ncbi:ABC-type branched-subunit amino acid transport system ATPase component [Actinocorallia herbida]|uniref:ABC-type branched-subunit amino acid transport system ATPase component n=1 Tax=Actinocorallia herbida TaxID=58109 RepID=A0A3N1CQQ8_9ACTN|nr:ATP-binding cassette domain-containing protein [Actinocorallia herbida]ROO83484.1 ABC-type branched-subunit amino acid transport system ATPase component [Actinocorallia herbida]
MTEFLGLVLSGLVTGAIFALLGSGLTLSYAATGVFNFAHGAVGFVAALLYFELTTGAGWPAWPAVVLTVGVFAPLLGYTLHRLMFRGLAAAGETQAIVATIGLLIALPALGLWLVEVFGLPSVTEGASARGLGPQPPTSFEPFDGVRLDSDQLVVFALAALAAAGLWLVMRHTPLGLRMRATVDQRALATWRGVDADAASAQAWMLSSGLAALAGVLAVPALGLDQSAFTVLMFTAATASVFGRLRSIPWTFAAGLALGVVQNLVAGYGGALTEQVTGLATGVPALLLLVGLVVLNRARSRVAGTVAEDAPPPDHLADLPRWRRVLPWAAGGTAGLVWVLFFAGDYWAGLIATGLVFSLIFCSFVVVTGVGGMVNLAQASFAALAALTAGLVLGHGLPFGLAAVLGVLAAVAAGLIVALPALRLGGKVLALATLALGLLADQVLFQIDVFSNGTIGWKFPAIVLGPTDTGDPRTRIVFLLAVIGVVALLIRNLERSPSGRAILAVRSAPTAAQTSGVSAVRTKLTLFAVASGICGLGGVLFATFAGQIYATDLRVNLGFFWLAVVVLQGVRRIGGAVVGGLIVGVSHEILSYVTDSTHVEAILFGLGGVILAKHPDGVLAQFAEQRYRRRRRAALAEEAQAEETPADGAAEPSDDGALVLEGIVAGYGDTTVLRGVDLSVRGGEVVALLGANGAGKSTACAVAIGAVTPSSGRVLLGGADVTGASAFKRAREGMYLAPEGRGVFPGLTVEENLTLWLPSASDRATAYERFPRLAERRDLPAGSLSGGEQQILALAPALVRPPKVLIADEPSLGLAPLVVRQVFDLFGELRERGVALLVVEEKAHEALEIADTVAYMGQGRITWRGPRAEVDADELTAAYLGIRPAGSPVEEGSS